ncbi:MAG: methionine--tRNA ligase [Pseudomonadota bacterium]
MNNHYITTPIYYASGEPHLGHAYTSMVASLYRRYHTVCGDSAYLITGTDEHGQKIETAAATAGVPVQDFVADKSVAFSELWQSLKLPVDAFVRTTDSDHVAYVQAYWNRLLDRGDLYLGRYEGLYCVDCEQYVTSGETCEIHRKPLTPYAEPSYFFRLSHYQDALIEHIEAHTDFITPESRRQEVLSFLKGQPLRDLSVSRTSTRWGVPVPDDPDHVIYVWLDALLTYVTAAPGGERGWEEASTRTHFIGKDILTFHGVYWPALLLAGGLKLPDRIVANGWLTVEGRKIAKSDPATIVDPAALARSVGTDGLPWYLIRGVRLGQDVNFDREHLRTVLNADLANGLGNLVARTIGLTRKRFPDQLDTQTAIDHETYDALIFSIDQVGARLTSFRISQAAEAFVAGISLLNRYLQQREPWKLPDEDCAPVLATVLRGLCDLSVVAAVFVPDIAARIRVALACPETPYWNDIGRKSWGSLSDSSPVFARLS